MKVLALVILVVGSCSALGSGPYLPSGWKPAGPAFYLPTEVEKPVAAVLLKEAPVQETESSGSSFLREYGPPETQTVEKVAVQIQDESESSSSALNTQEVSQDITQQALPEPITEQAFVVIEAKFNENEANAEVNQEVITEQQASVTEVGTSTESQTTEEETTQLGALVEGKSDIETQTESSVVEQEATTATLIEEEKIAEVRTEVTAEAEEVKEEVTQQETVDSNSNIVSAVERVEVAEVKTVEGVKNIAEAIVNLENEIKAQQVQVNEEVTELRTNAQESTGSVQKDNEGFLEYGPPGFTEYGPPKGDLKTIAEGKPSVTSNEINEARRRRFSPKFNIPKRKQ